MATQKMGFTCASKQRTRPATVKLKMGSSTDHPWQGHSLPPTFIVVLAAVAFLTFGTSVSLAAENFVKTYSNAVEYITWVDDGTGHLTGQYQEERIDASDGTKIDNQNAAFTGIRNGTDISLSFSLLSAMAGATWTGVLHSHSLVLTRPSDDGLARTTFDEGTFDDYKTAVRHLKATVARTATNLALLRVVQGTASQLQDTGQSIESAVADLAKRFAPDTSHTGIRSSYGDAWSKMQADWSKEQGDAAVRPMTCYQKGVVQYDSGVVDYDLGTIQYVDGQLKNFEDQVGSEIATITSGVTELEQLAPTYDREATEYALAIGSAVPPKSAPGVAKLSKILYPQRDTYEQDLIKEIAVGGDYDRKAAALDEQAKTFAQDLVCSG